MFGKALQGKSMKERDLPHSNKWHPQKYKWYADEKK